MPTCTVASFTAGTPCYRNFSTTDRASILIYFNALELAAIGGTDYSAELGSGGDLSLDSKCLMNLTDNLFVAPNVYQLLVAYNNAVAAGASPVTDPDDLATAIQCNKNFPMGDKAAQMLWLLCQLGEHAAQ